MRGLLELALDGIRATRAGRSVIVVALVVY
jgi:hypothetical protein